MPRLALKLGCAHAAPHALGCQEELDLPATQLKDLDRLAQAAVAVSPVGCLRLCAESASRVSVALPSRDRRALLRHQRHDDCSEVD